MANATNDSKTTNTTKPGTFGAHSAVKCSHCGSCYFHGAHCGCAGDKAARGIAPVDFDAMGFSTLEF
ncbi:MAG: hypothetical protein R3337_00140 [Gammaproteobacteria bacterium]|nr:hypothetical protein [Gammaproteobacteria bacterium]